MTNRRLDMHRLTELVRLHRLNHKPRQVARLLGMSPNTERKYRNALELAGLLQGHPDQLPALDTLKDAVLEAHPPASSAHSTSTAQPWAHIIQQKLRAGASPKAIYDFLDLEHDDFCASYDAVKRLSKAILKKLPPNPQDIAIPVQTSPAHTAQIDFGYAGSLFDPDRDSKRKAWFFVMTLSYSRHIFVQFVFDQSSSTFLQLHVDAFDYFGGVPETIVPDNLKAAVIRTAFGQSQTTALNRSYRELARHYGFLIDPTPPRSPQKKGKVESSVKYVKHNFLAPRALEGLALGTAQEQLDKWIERKASQRIHGVTGRKPIELFLEEEKDALKQLPQQPYTPTFWKEATVRGNHIIYQRKFYSVPWALEGSVVWAKEQSRSIFIYHEDHRVATHAKLSKGSHSTNPAHLPEGRGEWRHREPAYWKQQAEAMGKEVYGFILELFESDEVLSQVNTAASVMQLLNEVPPQRANDACKRARHFGNYSYQGLKQILHKGLEQQPLEETETETTVWSVRPRFAREVDEFLQ